LVFLSFDFASQGGHRLLYESRLLICHPPSTPVPSQLHSCTWSKAGAAAEQHVPKETEQTQADQTTPFKVTIMGRGEALSVVFSLLISDFRMLTDSPLRMEYILNWQTDL
ncbi:hypothetical protein Nmel_001794, partial [Mimus melanotis]